MGLAAGNRLKVTKDEKLIAKLINVGKLSSNKLVFGNAGLKVNAILSNSSSASSILSSSSSSLSTTSGSTTTTSLSDKVVKINGKFQSNIISTGLNEIPLFCFCQKSSAGKTIENQNQEEQTIKTPLTLPTKLPMKTGLKLTSFMSSNERHPAINEAANDDVDDDEDDYDYDIPENNRPITVIESPVLTSDQAKLTKSSDVRKSISPTIDSGWYFYLLSYSWQMLQKPLKCPFSIYLFRRLNEN